MTMHHDERHTPNPTLLGAALAIAPAAIGCAAGLLLADRVKDGQRRGLATLLFSVGAVATLPLAADYVVKILDSPAFRRGSNRKLQGIRSSGLNSNADVIGGEEYFLEQVN